MIDKYRKKKTRNAILITTKPVADAREFYSESDRAKPPAEGLVWWKFTKIYWARACAYGGSPQNVKKTCLVRKHLDVLSDLHHSQCRCPTMPVLTFLRMFVRREVNESFFYPDTPRIAPCRPSSRYLVLLVSFPFFYVRALIRWKWRWPTAGRILLATTYRHHSYGAYRGVALSQKASKQQHDNHLVKKKR